MRTQKGGPQDHGGGPMFTVGDLCLQWGTHVTGRFGPKGAQFHGGPKILGHRVSYQAVYPTNSLGMRLLHVQKNSLVTGLSKTTSAIFEFVHGFYGNTV